MVNMATLVLPAPVGAQINMFSLVRYAVSKTTLWILKTQVMNTLRTTPLLTSITSFDLIYYLHP